MCSSDLPSTPPVDAYLSFRRSVERPCRDSLPEDPSGAVAGLGAGDCRTASEGGVECGACSIRDPIRSVLRSMLRGVLGEGDGIDCRISRVRPSDAEAGIREAGSGAVAGLREGASAAVAGLGEGGCVGCIRSRP